MRIVVLFLLHHTFKQNEIPKHNRCLFTKEQKEKVTPTGLRPEEPALRHPRMRLRRRIDLV